MGGILRRSSGSGVYWGGVGGKSLSVPELPARKAHRMRRWQRETPDAADSLQEGRLSCTKIVHRELHLFSSRRGLFPVCCCYGFVCDYETHSTMNDDAKAEEAAGEKADPFVLWFHVI